MFDLQTLLILFLVGCIGGVLAGLLGIGGGVVYVGVLAYYLKSYNLESAEARKTILSVLAQAGPIVERSSESLERVRYRQQ